MNLVALAPQWLIIVLGILLFAAAAQDAAQLRISNVTVALVFATAIVAMVVVGPEAHLWQNAVVFAALLAAGIPPFAAGKLGGGDVKLFAASGLWFDLAGAFQLLVAVLIAGGLLAMVVIVLRLFGWSAAVRERIIILRPKAGIPYAVAIATGVLLTFLLQRVSFS
jgi:prepilin peptidase CpaA